MIKHAYPVDLAKFVYENWNKPSPATAEIPSSTVEPHDQLPPLPVLESLLSVCYQASLLKDEQRQVMLRLIISNHRRFSDEDGPPMGLQPLVFSDYRSFNANELRKLSPAAGFYRSLIGVDIDSKDNPFIWGIIHSGPRWLRMLRGGRGTPSVLPPYLVIYITAPGRIEVNKGLVTIGQLADGRVFGPSMNVFDSKWLPLSFASIRSELRELHLKEKAEHGHSWANLDPDVTRIIGQHTIRRIIASMRSFEHGGTLLIVPPELGTELSSKNPFLSLMYKFTDGVARARFRMLMIKLMNRLAECGSASVDESDSDQQVGWQQYAVSQDKALTTLDEGVFEMAHLIAGLSNVDGAVVMTKRFELLGFAGEIACADNDVSVVARALDLEAENVVMESAERVGTRHRSVYRFCNSIHDAVAVVVSQDGGVRIVSWKDGRVTYWDHQATTISLDF